MVGSIIEAALGQDNGHTAAGFEEVQVALDEQDVPPHAGTRPAVAPGDFILVEDAAFLDVAGKRRVGHQNVKVEPPVLLRFGAQGFQSFKAAVISTDPAPVVGDAVVPAVIVQGIQMHYISFAVAGNKVEGAGDADGFFVKVNAEHPLGILLVGLGYFVIGEQAAGEVENGMHRKAAAAGGGVNHILAPLGIQHLHAHINDMTRREILPLFALGRLVDQILKGFVHYLQVGVEQFDIL